MDIEKRVDDLIEKNIVSGRLKFKGNATVGTTEQNGYYVYPAKHCNDEHEVTHISEFGFVNRFGFFITKEPLFVHSHEDIMIGQGWFVRKHTTDFMEALQTLDDKEKADGR